MTIRQNIFAQVPSAPTQNVVLAWELAGDLCVKLGKCSSQETTTVLALDAAKKLIRTTVACAETHVLISEIVIQRTQGEQQTADLRCQNCAVMTVANMTSAVSCAKSANRKFAH